jgi:predicted DNA repair protein MutK
MYIQFFSYSFDFLQKLLTFPPEKFNHTMASGFFAILDDIAALMDNVSVNIKIATKKTAGILGDDLAVNAEKSTGFVSSRELPVLWAITKGSFLNKLIIVPIVLVLNAFLPSVITVVLLLGGFFLAYEGVEKIVEFFFHRHHEEQAAEETENQDNAALEKAKIKSAITTDFILSIEIVIIALSTVLEKNLTTQILTVSAVSIIATIGVYGIVALIVRMDDFGLLMIRKAKSKGLLNALGALLVKLLPLTIKFLGVVGTIALLLVAGGIFTHSSEYLHHLFHEWPDFIKEFTFGIIGGLLVLALVSGGKFVYSKIKKA